MRIAGLILTYVTFIGSVSTICTAAWAEVTAAAVSGKHILEVCSLQEIDIDKVACLNATQESLFDFHALNFCRTQHYDSDKNLCYRIIANKQFTPEVLATCERQHNDSGKRNCLKAANFRLIQEPAGYSPVRKRLEQALKALQNKDYGMAEELIHDLHQRLNY